MDTIHRLATGVAALVISGSALAQQDAALPKSMEGRWSSTSGSRVTGSARVEVVNWQGPDKAEVAVTLTDVYNRPPQEGAGTCRVSDTGTAERTADSWQIKVRNARCASFIIDVKRVDGQQKFDGSYANDVGGRGTIYFEWK